MIGSKVSKLNLWDKGLIDVLRTIWHGLRAQITRFEMQREWHTLRNAQIDSIQNGTVYNLNNKVWENCQFYSVINSTIVNSRSQFTLLNGLRYTWILLFGVLEYQSSFTTMPQVSIRTGSTNKLMLITNHLFRRLSLSDKDRQLHRNHLDGVE